MMKVFLLNLSTYGGCPERLWKMTIRIYFVFFSIHNFGNGVHRESQIYLLVTILLLHGSINGGSSEAFNLKHLAA